MKQRYFRIKLKDRHLPLGLTSYAVAKTLGINQNTVRKYLTEEITQSYLPADVIYIAKFFGLDWRDPSVVEVVEESDEENEEALLAALA